MKSKKRILSVLLAGCICSAFSPLTVNAEQSTETKTIKVGYFDFYGYIDPDSEGGYSGYGVDFLNTIADYTNYTYDYIPGTWSECLERLQNGEIDLVGGARWSEERGEVYDYSLPYMGDLKSFLCVNDDSPLSYEDYQDMDGITVGFVEQSRNVELLQTFAEGHDFSFNEAYYATQAEAVAAMNNGTIDAVAVSNYIIPDNIRTICIFNTEPQYIITAKGSPIDRRN